MPDLTPFSLEGKVALVPGGGGAMGSAIASALARAGAQVAVANRTLDKADADRRGDPGRGRRGDRHRVRRHRRVRRRAGGRRPPSSGSGTSTSSSTASAAAPARSCSRPTRTRATPGTGSWSSTSARWSSRRCRGARDDRRAATAGAVVNLSSVRARARHQRRLLRLRRGQGRDRVAHPPVGDRVGEARHQRQRRPADVRRHAPGREPARRPGVQGRASSTASRSGASARPAT